MLQRSFIEPSPTQPREVVPTAWIQPAETVTVHGIDISCGYFYLGNGLKTGANEIEPSQIDPGLDIVLPTADRWFPPDFNSIASYHKFVPEHRGALLRWLADGRPVEQATYPFVRLLLAGIERRVVVDILPNPLLYGELAGLRECVEEIATLDSITIDDEALDEEPEYTLNEYGQKVVQMYGGVGFGLRPFEREYLRYLTAKVLDLIDAVNYLETGEVPGYFPYIDIDATPICLHLALSDCAVRQIPITAPLALAWGMHHHRVRKRKAATWQPFVFARLFELRFAEAFPRGIPVRGGSRMIALRYARTAEGGYYRTFPIKTVMNVYDRAAQLNKVSTIFAQVESELRQFVSVLNGPLLERQRLLAIGSLPRELIGMFPEETHLLRTTVGSWLGNREWAVITGNVLIEQWPASTPGQLTGPQTKSLFNVLGALGVGVEPDPRFFGLVVTAESSAIVFRQDPAAQASGDITYNGARIVALLCVLVTQADGPVDDARLLRAARHAGAIFGLLPEFQHRLGMYLRWITFNPIKTNGLAKQAQSLGIAGMERVGLSLCAFIMSESGATPANIKALGKAYTVLGLDPALVTSHLHAGLTGHRGGPSEIIDIRSPMKPAAEESGRGLELQPGIVKRTIAESRTISRVLSDLFAEDDATEFTVKPDRANRSAFLDDAHAELLRRLVAQDLWSRAEFNALAAQFNLLPEGAIDTLNEAAYEAVGEPLLEGDGTLIVYADVAKELRR